MRAALALLATLIAGNAMAYGKDRIGGLGGLGGVQLAELAHPTPTRKAQEDADMYHFITEFQQGRMSMEDAVKAFRAKWYGGQDPDPKAMNNPEILLPETRDEQRILNWTK